MRCMKERNIHRIMLCRREEMGELHKKMRKAAAALHYGFFTPAKTRACTLLLHKHKAEKPEMLV